MRLVNPDGSPRSGSRAADYALLSSYLERRSGLEVGTPVGVFANLGRAGARRERDPPAHAVAGALPVQQRRHLLAAGRPRPARAFHLGWHAQLGDELLALAALYVLALATLKKWR